MRKEDKKKGQLSNWISASFYVEENHFISSILEVQKSLYAEVSNKDFLRSGTWFGINRWMVLLVGL